MVKRDITGQRFGKLTALKDTDERRHGAVIWNCLCECGNICQASTSNLRGGRAKSCGCSRNDRYKITHLIGQKFGWLTILKDSGKREKRYVIWDCLCKCGAVYQTTTKDLKYGRAKSCGCMPVESAAEYNRVSSSFRTNLRKTEDLFFWVVVQACRDIALYDTDSRQKDDIREADFLHAYAWIVDGETQEILGREMTFSEALQALGVNPDNIEVLRYAIMRSPCSTRAWKSELVQKAYSELDIPANDLEPWWRMVANLILNKRVID